MALFIDIETIGFPDNKHLPYGEQPLYTSIDKYNNARIVQICVMLCNDKFENMMIKDNIIKLDNFNITNSDCHKITNEISIKNGRPFTVVANELHNMIKQSSHIFAHNSNFDINIFKSELFRYGLYNIIDEINKKKIICTMNFTKNIVKIKNKYGYKDPKLSELYEYVTTKKMTNEHNAKFDVINLHEAIKKLYDDNKLKFAEQIILLPIVNEEIINEEVIKEEVNNKKVNNVEEWKIKLVRVKKYIDENKKRPSETNKNIEIKKDARWIGRQQTNYSKQVQIMKNPDIRKLWSDFINDPLYKLYF